MRSIRNKTLEIEEFLGRKPHILCFQEHWLNKHEYAAIDGYRLASAFYRSKAEHGGTCIYVRDCIRTIDIVREDVHCVESHLECSGIELIDYGLVVITVYSPPTSNFEIFIQKLYEVLEQLRDKTIKRTLVLTGDFNIDLISEKPHVQRMAKTLLELLQCYDLIQTIYQPTRISAQRSSLVDNIFITKSREFESNITNSSLSDHMGQYLRIKTTNGKHEKKTVLKRKFSEPHINTFIRELANIDWVSTLYTQQDVNAAYNIFHEQITKLINSTFPIYKSIISGNRKKAWVTNELKKDCNKKRQLYISSLKGEIPKQEYIDYAKEVKCRLNKAKRQYHEKLIQESDNKSKTIWHLINHFGNKKFSSPKTIIDDAQGDEQKLQILNTMNLKFLEMCPDLQEAKPLLGKIKQNSETIFMSPTTETEIYNIILTLKNKKTTGWDEIPIVLLKNSANILAAPLSYIINLMLNTGIFPDKLKVAEVTPIHKKGDYKDALNYRPIAILSCISKIFEKSINKRLMDFFEGQNLFSQYQNGFRRNKGTIRTVYQTLYEVFESFNNKQMSLGLFIDLSKAFDSIKHDILLEKLERYGIRGVPLELIKSYLKNRPQCIKVTDSVTGRIIKSDCAYVNKGVPQGSILGPLLYICYTNDMPQWVKGKVRLYADDTSIIVQHYNTSELQEGVVEAFRSANSWFASNNLRANPEKTVIMQFDTKATPESLNIFKINEKDLITTKLTTTFLGLKLDARLNWKEHIDRVTNVLAKCTYQLKNVSWLVSVGAAVSAYFGVVDSNIRYGIVLWGCSVEMDRVFKSQKRCIRSVFRLQPQESCRRYFVEFGILTCYAMYVLEAVKFILDNEDLFTSQRQVHQYNIRGREDLLHPVARLSRLQHNAHYCMTRVYNKLPAEVREKPRNRVVTVLKRFLLKTVPYSHEDFLHAKLSPVDFED